MILFQCSAICGQTGTQSRNVECRNTSGLPSPSSQYFVMMIMLMMAIMMMMVSTLVKMTTIPTRR